MLELTCTGSRFGIGYDHGLGASAPISRSISFYAALFLEKCSMDWGMVTAFARRYQPYLSSHFPDFVEEMKGVAKGAGREYDEILALNVRTEIAFGLFSDGCTALFWKGKQGESYLAQNWDWDPRQAENLVHLHIKLESGIAIHMITEAGIIGKIGFNNKGVGCAQNAIRTTGASVEKLPCHLAIRAVLESLTCQEAIATLEKWGVASACHLLVADSQCGTGLECSSEDVAKLEMDSKGVIVHTNHYLLERKADVVAESVGWLPDTRFRLTRAREMLGATEQPSEEALTKILSDEVEGDGASICRREGKDNLVSLFGIVMNLAESSALILIGRPASPNERLRFKFC